MSGHATWHHLPVAARAIAVAASNAVAAAQASALGIHDQDEQAPQPDPTSLARHTALLLADLLTATPDAHQRADDRVGLDMARPGRPGWKRVLCRTAARIPLDGVTGI
jgi:hypothetical protein